MPSSFSTYHRARRVPGLPVHLVDKGEVGDVPHSADLEQLRVCASTPLAASMTMTAESAAIRSAVSVL